MQQDARRHGDLTLAPTTAGVFVWRFEQRHGDPWGLTLVYVIDDLEDALRFAHAAMAKTKGQVWLQQQDGLVAMTVESSALGYVPSRVLAAPASQSSSTLI